MAMHNNWSNQENIDKHNSVDPALDSNQAIQQWIDDILLPKGVKTKRNIYMTTIINIFIQNAKPKFSLAY